MLLFTVAVSRTKIGMCERPRRSEKSAPTIKIEDVERRANPSSAGGKKLGKT